VAHFDLRSLQPWLRSFDLELTQEQLDQAQIHLETLLLWNRKMNLVSQTGPDEVITKHLADSFVTASLLHNDERIADLGSGAGFPGIPIAIARPESAVFLVEANQKKASFLAEVAGRCRLPHATVINERIEMLRGRVDVAGSLTVVTARALWKIPELLAAAGMLLVSGGRLIAMKGSDYRAEIPRLEETRFSLETVVSYELPDGARRCLVVLRFT
jgi:16S rRNA (guanine527-N7)-methyltransferase